MEFLRARRDSFANPVIQRNLKGLLADVSHHALQKYCFSAFKESPTISQGIQPTFHCPKPNNSTSTTWEGRRISQLFSRTWLSSTSLKQGQTRRYKTYMLMAKVGCVGSAHVAIWKGTSCCCSVLTSSFTPPGARAW